MAYQGVFKRYEMKYILTKEQKELFLRLMEPYMVPDSYGATVIRNVYYDTDSYRLIRRSIERPVYKEKLRVRSYSQVCSDGTVFAELKKKYKSVVYKRRISLSAAEAEEWLCGRCASPSDTQISREIDYFKDFYKTLAPRVYLSYKREAFFSCEDRDFRVTFDEDVLARTSDVSLTREVWGEPVLDEGQVLMEIKSTGGIPLWMSAALSENKVYKTSFSKYGTAYKKYIFPIIKEDQHA